MIDDKDHCIQRWAEKHSRCFVTLLMQRPGTKLPMVDGWLMSRYKLSSGLLRQWEQTTGESLYGKP